MDEHLLLFNLVQNFKWKVICTKSSPQNVLSNQTAQFLFIIKKFERSLLFQYLIAKKCACYVSLPKLYQFCVPKYICYYVWQETIQLVILKTIACSIRISWRELRANVVSQQYGKIVFQGVFSFSCTFTKGQLISEGNFAAFKKQVKFFEGFLW